MKSRSSGFTLTELLIVIAIIGLLAGIILSSLNTARAKAQVAANRALEAEIKKAMLSADDANEVGWFGVTTTQGYDCTNFGGPGNDYHMPDTRGSNRLWISDNNSWGSMVNDVPYNNDTSCSMVGNSHIDVQTGLSGVATEGISFGLWVKQGTSLTIEPNGSAGITAQFNTSQTNIDFFLNGTTYTFDSATYPILKTQAGKWYYFSFSHTSGKTQIYFNGQKVIDRSDVVGTSPGQFMDFYISGPAYNPAIMNSAYVFN